MRLKLFFRGIAAPWLQGLKSIQWFLPIHQEFEWDPIAVLAPGACIQDCWEATGRVNHVFFFFREFFERVRAGFGSELQGGSSFLKCHKRTSIEP